MKFPVVFAAIAAFFLTLPNASHAAQGAREANELYWRSVETLCQRYSGSPQHSPCNRANGVEAILEHVAKSCAGDRRCTQEAAVICTEQSAGNASACSPSVSGLDGILAALKQLGVRLSPVNKPKPANFTLCGIAVKGISPSDGRTIEQVKRELEELDGDTNLVTCDSGNKRYLIQPFKLVVPRYSGTNYAYTFQRPAGPDLIVDGTADDSAASAR